MITLRPYQRTAVDALFRYFERATGNPLLVMPTGSGKSPTLAVFLKEAIEAFPETRVLVLTHRKELIEQDAAAIRKAWPDAPVGIYSAGLSYRQIRQITVAGVQSVHKKAEQIGHVDLCVVDECHLVAHDGDGMYRRLLSDLRAKNDALKVIGLTATPYRLSGGLLTRGASKIFTSVAHDVEVGPLVEQGYLAPLSSPATSAAYDTSAVSTVGGDFAIGELVGAVDRQTEITHAAMTEALALTADRCARLVFCVSIEHAECVARWLRDANQACEVITGDTDPLMRSSVIGRFRRGDLPWLVGVDVLTTGFDAPCCDAIVLLRPTQSTSLYVQIVGRGMRIADGKSDCIVLDYGGNVARHGPITAIRHVTKQASASSTLKECPTCLAEVKISKRECPECGYIFPEQPREVTHDKKAARDAIMGPAPEPVWIEVDEVRAYEWTKKTNEGEEPKPPTVCVEYRRLGREVAREWLCPEHGGYATQKFCRWWFERGGDLPAPHTVATTIERIEAGELREVDAVLLVQDGKWKRVARARSKAEEKPSEVVEDDLPF